MREYEQWIILDEFGDVHGNYDQHNGGFEGACYACAWLIENYAYPEIYFLVLISDKDKQNLKKLVN